MRLTRRCAPAVLVAILFTSLVAPAAGEALAGPRPAPSLWSQRASKRRVAAATARRRAQDATVQRSTAARHRDELERGVAYSYTDFMQDVARRQVAFAAFSPLDGTVKVELRDGREHTVGYPPGAESLLARQLVGGGTSVTFQSSDLTAGASGGFGTYLFVSLAGMLVLVALFSVLKRSGALSGMGGGANQKHPAGPGKSDAATTIPDVKFADVAGIDEAVEEVAEMKDFLVPASAARYERLGAKMPSGVLLYGPPGTGKTLLAKALAAEAGVPFFSCSGSEFVEMFVGVGASRVRQLFAAAKKAAPAVIFIDELDAVGAKRAGGENPGNRESDQTLNQLLVELDGFSGREHIIVMGATNRLDTLDPALTRPGRFSRHIMVSTPDEPGRLAILNVHTRMKPLAPGADLARLAHITAGNSGAELAEVVNEAAIWAGRHDREAITNEDLWEGLCRVLAGPKKRGSVLAHGEREVIAYHEAGHVLAGELCPSQDKTQHVTIEARGQALGFALKGNTDRGLQNEQYLHEQLIFILGGRAAEFVTYGTVSSGAANDLQQANLAARQAVEKWGISPRVGQVVNEDGGFKHSLSEQMRGVIDEEVRRLVADAYRDAVALMQQHESQLKALTGALLGSNHLDRCEIELAMDGVVAEPRRPRLAHTPELEPVFGGQRAAEPAHPEPGQVINGSDLFGRRRGLRARVAATAALTRRSRRHLQA